MSSAPTGSKRAVGPSPLYGGIVRRIVNLPSSISGGVSRAMTLMGVGGSGRRDHHRLQHDDHHHHLMNHSPQFRFQEQVAPEDQEELAFLTSFQHQYGVSHPFFYACPFAQALQMAEEDSRFLFIYLHSTHPQHHPYTAALCRDTLCSEVVVQFLDANFVSWAAMADRGEGLQLAALLKAPSFPLCAIVSPASGSTMAILRQVEGLISPGELVEILQRTIEEQGLAFRASRKYDITRVSSQQLREEQDAAFHAALLLDKEKDRIQELNMNELQKHKQKQQANHGIPKNNSTAAAAAAAVNLTKTKQLDSRKGDGGDKVKKNQLPTTPNEGKDLGVTNTETHTLIQIRFPNGERKEQSFLSTDKIQSIYGYIDSLNIPGIGSYQLISNFPRKKYGFEQLGMTLKEAGLHPRASLFLERVE